MAWNPDEWFQHEWSTQVKHQYQNLGYTFREMVMPPVTIKGMDFTFPIGGIGEASKIIKDQKSRPMNAGRGKVKITADAYEAMDRIHMLDKADLGKLAPAEKDLISHQQGAALGRVHDRVIFDSIHKHSGKYGKVVGSFDEPWTLENSVELRRRLVQKGVPFDGNINCVMPSTAYSQLVEYPQFSSADYVGPDGPMLQSSGRRSWRGIHWHEVSDDVFEPFAVANSRDLKENTGQKNGFTFYCWHKFAVGSGEQFGKQTDFEWHMLDKYWYYSDWISIGGQVLHDFEQNLGMINGIVECRVDNAAEIQHLKTGVLI